MSNIKKAPADVTVSAEAKTLQAKNTAKTNRSQVKKFLLEGEANALPMRELARLTGVSERQVRKLIERERRAGGLILSSGKGYFLPSPDNAHSEMRRYIRRVDARMCSNRNAVKRIKQALKELESQDNGQEMLEL